MKANMYNVYIDPFIYTHLPEYYTMLAYPYTYLHASRYSYVHFAYHAYVYIGSAYLLAIYRAQA